MVSKIKYKIKILFSRILKRIFNPVLKQIDCQSEMLHIVAESNLKTRFIVKQSQEKPIHVLFVCHEPNLWSMFDSIYRVMEEDDTFSPQIIALPYKRGRV